MTIKTLFPSIEPSLDLNFAASKRLDPRITFTRASNATFVNGNGLIETAAVDQARFDHSPTAGESLGLLVEEQRTNLLLRSEEFDDAYWVKTETTVSANATVAPDGATTADKLVESTTNSQHTLASVAITWVGNTQYTATFYAKAGERFNFDILLGTAGNWVNSERVATFNLNTGTVLFSPNSPAVASIQAVGNGWYRCRVTATTVTSPSASAVFIRMADSTGLASYQGNGTSGIYVWGAQLEAGAFPTSYIPTTTATVTRSADVCSISGSNFSSWYRQDAQTWFGEYAPIYTASATVPANTPHLLQVYNNAVNLNNYAVRGVDSTTSQLCVARNPTTGSQFPSVVTGFGIAGAYRKVSYAIDSSFLSVSANGIGPGVIANNVAALMATHDILSIGSGTGGAPPYQLNGTIRRLTYWPQRLANSTLQAVTQ